MEFTIFYTKKIVDFCTDWYAENEFAKKKKRRNVQ